MRILALAFRSFTLKINYSFKVSSEAWQYLKTFLSIVMTCYQMIMLNIRFDDWTFHFLKLIRLQKTLLNGINYFKKRDLWATSLSVKFGWNWRIGSGDEGHAISSLRNYFPSENDKALLWTNFRTLQPRIFFPKFGWNWARFFISSMYFRFVLIISLGKWQGPSFE